MKKRIAVFASGSGSNAEKIFQYFTQNEVIEIGCLVYNNVNAGVIEKAKRFDITTFFESNEAFVSGESVLELCKKEKIDFIVLAGFLRKIPLSLIHAYPEKIINIHPALLPKYGGKGMYGHFVHEKVSENGETESGITIHLVDEIYDNGKILAQHKCAIISNENPTEIAKKVLALEHQYFAPTIENYILNK